MDLRRWLTKQKLTLEEYLSLSSIHGFRYVGSRPWYERIAWILIISTSIWLCCGQIYQVFVRWNSNPIVINYDQQFSSIGDIPFPAITLCLPLQLILNNHAITFERFAELVEEDLVDEEALNFFAVHIPLLPANLQEPYWSAFDSNPKNLSVPKLFFPLEKRFNEIGTCKGIRFEDSWPCDFFFRRIFTKHGYCHTFNMLNRSELLRQDVFMDYRGTSRPLEGWSKETGYASSDASPAYTIHEYPVRTHFSMRQLEIFFNFYKHYASSSDATKYFEIIQLFIHNPYDYPWNHETMLTLKSDSLTNIVIEPKKLIADESLKGMYTPEQRKCYFDGEKELRYFKIYSESNCELECLANWSIKYCGCVPHWMPRTSGVTVCGEEAKIITKGSIFHYLNYEQSWVLGNEKVKHLVMGCNCFPECNSVKYIGTINNVDELGYRGKMADHYVTEIKLKDENTNVSSYIEEESKWKMTRVEFSVSFKESTFLSLKRSPMYTYTDFIASCGGLFGLFMGMSVISFIELIYFFTIRLLNN